MRRIAFILPNLLLACSLLGCVQQATGYRTADRDEAFVEERLAGSRYRVSFRGARDASRATVEETVLRRAAELSRRAGAAKFAVLDRLSERQVRVFPVAVRVRDFDLPSCGDGRRHGFPERTLVLNQENFTYREIVSYAATLIVQPFTDAPPDDAFRIYDVSDVLADLAIRNRRGVAGSG